MRRLAEPHDARGEREGFVKSQVAALMAVYHSCLHISVSLSTNKGLNSSRIHRVGGAYGTEGSERRFGEVVTESSLSQSSFS